MTALWAAAAAAERYAAEIHFAVHTRPQLAKRNPIQPIEALQFRTGLLPLPNSELLAKSGGLESKFGARHEPGAGELTTSLRRIPFAYP